MVKSVNQFREHADPKKWTIWHHDRSGVIIAVIVCVFFAGIVLRFLMR